MIADPTIRQAKALLAAHRRELRKARAPRVQPVAEGQRQPRKRDNAYLAWIRRLPCLPGLIRGGCEGPVEACHVRFSIGTRRNPGMQQKPDDRLTLPACHGHHMAQHATNEARWWSALGISPHALCDTLSAVFDADGDAVALLQRIARESR